MIEYKRSVSAIVPVRLVNAGGTAVASVVSGSVTATVLKSDGTTQAVSLAGAWTEIGTGAFYSQGVYTVTLSAGNLDTAGFLSYAVAVTGAVTYIGVVKVVANEEVDTYTRIGAPVSASISDDIENIHKYHKNRRVVYSSGSYANKEVLYHDDTTSVKRVWYLKDDTGAPTTGPSIFEKVLSGSV